ncbi:Oidioi.mRNA.OKI2018_I69.chr2.g4635.t1.cds [Oikopleura dioica]|uniref:Tetraspanin n=1 Tax=Oikopleura dioica TaxID=34765 RepID=A0ABN7SYD1_OIKDI|nr:Oidioi.mRNA.OKI2018_I69.chr2.g4635.t1.cds [Oikopleura dioica]
MTTQGQILVYGGRKVEISICTKFFLFGFNTLFWLIGIALIAIGVWAWTEKGFFDNISQVSDIPFDPVVLIISIGMVMFILSFAGCVGSLRENICLLKFFSTILGIIFFSELVCTILTFLYKDWFNQKFNDFIDTTITKYRDDPDLQNIIDFGQQKLECCGGVQGPQDWESNIYFNCSSSIELNGIAYRPVESCGVPFSCCAHGDVNFDGIANTQCGYGVRTKKESDWSEDIWTDGCIEKFEQFLRQETIFVSGIFIGVALLQIVPICFAQNMISDIEAIKATWVR